MFAAASRVLSELRTTRPHLVPMDRPQAIQFVAVTLMFGRCAGHVWWCVFFADLVACWLCFGWRWLVDALVVPCSCCSCVLGAVQEQGPSVAHGWQQPAIHACHTAFRTEVLGGNGLRERQLLTALEWRSSGGDKSWSKVLPKPSGFDPVSRRRKRKKKKT